MKITIVIITGILIFLGIKILRLGVRYIVNRYRRLSVLSNIMVMVEFLIWTGFVFQSCTYLFRYKFFYHYLIFGLILILFAFLTWFLLLDIFAGVLFRIKHSLTPGTFIDAGNIRGQIKAQALTSVILLTKEGLIQNIPYSKITNTVITEAGIHGITEDNIFKIRADLSLGKTEAEELIRTALINSPWSNLKEEPLIRFLEKNEKGNHFEVTLIASKKKQKRFITESLDRIPLLQITPEKGSSLAD